MHAYILNISQTITKKHNTTTTKNEQKSVVWIQVCKSSTVTHSQSRQKHKSHFNAITETISLSLFLSLSRVKVHSDVQSTATITLQNPSSSPGRVLSCLTQKGVFSVLQSLLFLSQYSVVSQSSTDVLLALIQCIPVRREKRKTVHRLQSDYARLYLKHT